VEARGCAAEMQFFGNDPKVTEVSQFHDQTKVLIAVVRSDTPTA